MRMKQSKQTYERLALNYKISIRLIVIKSPLTSPYIVPMTLAIAAMRKIAFITIKISMISPNESKNSDELIDRVYSLR